MLIPLDYYRILGVPIQADSSQLGQAYQQRLANVPHPDYSQTALTLRRQLLDEAYKTLTVASDRQTYDSQFLAKSYAEGPQLATPDG
ncbi:MAG: J domain-containing protein, partial [Cyanobacteria bacterium P01_F01_bin.153]